HPQHMVSPPQRSHRQHALGLGYNLVKVVPALAPQGHACNLERVVPALAPQGQVFNLERVVPEE
nr:hypothetical protein [Tanacetum cinerariifolium]